MYNSVVSRHVTFKFKLLLCLSLVNKINEIDDYSSGKCLKMNSKSAEDLQKDYIYKSGF